MPLFRLSHYLEFPPAWLARSDGLLCVGGDLSPERLILAYKNGIFPWYSPDEPILWWSPDPRLVLFPSEIKISKSLAKTIRQNKFEIRMDTAFEKVIQSCATPRKNETSTWLVDEMIDAYVRFHQLGYAHSIEAWSDGKLAGGLYGVSLGGTFFGESMFSDQSNASKAALVKLCRFLEKNGFDLIDCQVTTDHLLSLGACEIPRAKFLEMIHSSTKRKDTGKVWEPGTMP